VSGWRDLDLELDAWAAAGSMASFWWRDDDATTPTPALDRLLHVAGRARVPLALAVIPALASDDLARRLGPATAAVLQHGYAHRNHAPDGAKKSELGDDRPVGEVLRELRLGRERLEALFGPRALPVLVPPWNRIAPTVMARLASGGFRGLSVYRARATARQGDVSVVNAHLDPIDWKRGRGFVGEEAALALATTHLAARRLGQADRDEPTGLLTHHLVQDEAIWDFTAEFLARTTKHKAARWLAVASAFAIG
jgi:hypothetical protein